MCLVNAICLYFGSCHHHCVPWVFSHFNWDTDSQTLLFLSWVPKDKNHKITLFKGFYY
jgi:hypothetical protein